MSKLVGSEISEVVFQSGDFLFHENDRSYHFYVIQEGQVEIYRMHQSSKVTLAMVGPSNSIGEFAMIDRQPRSASAQAVTTVVATRVSEQAYQQLLEELPDWAMSIMKGLVERLRQTNEVVRRFQLSNPGLSNEVDALEFNSEVTIIDDAPFLSTSAEN